VAQAFQQEVKDGTFVNQVRRMQGRKGD
jgi:hypothetical protein